MRRSMLTAAFTVLATALLASGAFAQTRNVPLTLWEHGLMISDDGSASCFGRVPPTYYDVIGASAWYHYSVDLTTVLPNPVYIEYVEIGGDGWDFEGYWDNVSLQINGMERISAGDLSNIKGWEQIGSGRGSFLYEEANVDGTPGGAGHYRRTRSGADGGGAFLRQYIRACIDNPTSMTLSGDLYLVSQSLPNPGWWCCVYGCAPDHGEYPGEVRVAYADKCPPRVRGPRVFAQRESPR